jgi:hypothetical protein
MTTIATRTYLVGVIERAIAYYEVEAADARSAAENWQEGEFHDRDDEALVSEGPCNVRVEQPDGTWLRLPPSEWEAEPPAIAQATNPPSAPPATASGYPARFEIEHDPEENSDRVYVLVDGKFDVAIIRTDEGVVVDVYPKDGFDSIATTYAFDFDVGQESSTN